VKGPTAMITVWLILVAILCSCQTRRFVREDSNGAAEVTETLLLGKPVWRTEKPVQTPKDKADDILWYVMAAGFVGAPICVVMGYVMEGWKFWGGLALICVGIGFGALVLMKLVEWVYILILVPMVVAVGYTMYQGRDFSIWRLWNCILHKDKPIARPEHDSNGNADTDR